jgi:hypothetical protein
MEVTARNATVLRGPGHAPVNGPQDCASHCRARVGVTKGDSREKIVGRLRSPGRASVAGPPNRPLPNDCARVGVGERNSGEIVQIAGLGRPRRTPVSGADDCAELSNGRAGVGVCERNTPEVWDRPWDLSRPGCSAVSGTGNSDNSYCSTSIRICE